jgi:hypothetical protein
VTGILTVYRGGERTAKFLPLRLHAPGGWG